MSSIICIDASNSSRVYFNLLSLQVVQKIPLGRLLLETDAPWCDIRRTHAGNVELI